MVDSKQGPSLTPSQRHSSFTFVAKPGGFGAAAGSVFKVQYGERRIAVTRSTRGQDQPYASEKKLGCIEQVL